MGNVQQVGSRSSSSSEKSSSSVKKHGNHLTDFIFSWSLEDILNDNLYKNQVEKIPVSFESTESYFSSFVSPLLEEIRAEMCSKMKGLPDAPYSHVISISEATPHGKQVYDVKLDDNWRSSSNTNGKEPFRTMPGPGDMIVFAADIPNNVYDLKQCSCCFGYIVHVSRDGEAVNFKIRSSKKIETIDGLQRCSIALFLINLTTNKRIWDSLHLFGDSEMVKEVLCIPPEDNCNLCRMGINQIKPEISSLSSDLNESQYEAISTCLRKIQCNHKLTVDLIWGPPGTGKTKTVSVLLSSLLRLNCRTLVCAPTNVAIVELASRVVKVVRGARGNMSASSLRNIVLFGNKDHITSDVEDIYLDNRVKNLVECLGWKHSFCTMINFLEENVTNDKIWSRRDEFRHMVVSLKSNVSTICTYLTFKCILQRNLESLVDSVNSFDTFLFQPSLVSEEVSGLLCMRDECLCALRSVKDSLDELNLPSAANKDLLEEFCFRNASLIFCTASSSYKLLSMGNKDPIKCLVIDEAAQLKECESTILLQIPGARHVVLVGDEFQLTATVNSKVSQEAGFGRSLFERLSILGRPKHLLDMQYRMHPRIGSFPNSKFYQNRIVDAPNVKKKNYEKHYLPQPMFGPYSFIDISGGKELADAAGIRKNFVEVAVVLKILQFLYKACDESKEKISVGVVSPYSAQVAAIQQKLGHKFERSNNFFVNVRSIDGFQGGEEDIIIVSTVRSNKGGAVGFLSNPQRTNVALTRAKHALWILGNERTLSNSGSIWEEVIMDAKIRHCFFHADEDNNLAKVILDVQKELGMLDNLLDGDSQLFRNAKWKLLFSDNFRKSFSRIRSLETKNLALLMLSKLANGWRPKGNVGVTCKSSSNMLKQFKVLGLYIICSVDIVKESWYVQALKVWDILGLHEIEKLVTRLEGIFRMYTQDYLDRCKVKCFQGDLEVPMTWPASLEIVQFRSLDSSESQVVPDDKQLEKSKVRDSLLLMKFYSFSSGAVQNMLSSCDGGELGLPFELTDQEKEVVSFDKSSFILGRSGTGKTTVLTMKLFQNEQLFHIAADGFHEVNSNHYNWKQEFSEKDEENKEDVLHQLFVTVSPKLCYAVNQHVTQLKRSVCGGKSSEQSSSSVHMDDVDAATQFNEIPDSFVDLSPDVYPLIITFHKFLLMLDGTVGSSYFDRFQDVRRMGRRESRSVALNTFIRTNEVTFDKFDSFYWPHFSNKLTKSLDSATVFTEIMSVIKGGLEEGNTPAGELSQQDYVSLAEKTSGSSLSIQKREMVYCIFLEYKKKKLENGEFDLADLVLDLHLRLKERSYEGDEMDFVYIDEVQDLSMRQIALFKYICFKNVEQGFVFAGDTAQTIAKGIDFRFEDIRCLFYKEFIFGSRKDTVGKRVEEKGKISKIFHLSQNFRTHSAVLKLAQSVINLLYHYFPSSIDILSPEISLLSGEAPVLLGTKDKRNVLKSIFEKSGDAGGRFVGFGAEQVILVRDQNAKKEVCEYVEQKALVLTVTECKGLEFQDVLLYNFFSSSSQRDVWRVVNGYMKEKELLKYSENNIHVTAFNQEKHRVLCSELKQLYVAITRTKQRLWICDDFNLPMFDYWKRLRLVQEKNLDMLFLKKMQVCSSPDEWKSKGIKLFYEQNYEPALMCFERAGDTFWQTIAKASELRKFALRASDSAISALYLKEAAELFYTIGKAESAAQCFLDMKDYKRAGKIYLESFGDTKLEKAGECFYMAKSFKLAAEVYARGRLYSKSISACLEGNLFDMGFNYFESWKQYEALHGDRTVQLFLHRGALHYFEHNKRGDMMKFVKSFHSKDLMRTFLWDMNCVDELLLLEEEWGNFLEAAKLARIKKDCLREAHFLEKGGVLRESSMLVLWYVFSNYLSPQRSKNKPFEEKDGLLKKAKETSRTHSAFFYELVSTLADILSNGRTIDEDPETGLKFIQHWKANVPADLERGNMSDEVAKHEQDLLEKCARHYHRKNDRKSMMNHVEALASVESKRSLLKTLNCLDELLILEEQEGNFLVAAKIAEQKGATLREFDLLEKAGLYKEASLLILSYVLAQSLWSSGNQGWPLKEFTGKENLLEKAVLCSSRHSVQSHNSVSTEAKVLSGLQCSLSDMRECFISSQGNSSCSGEILSSRKILDEHIRMSPEMYRWDDLSVGSFMKHADFTDSQIQLSACTLFSIWNHWKEKIVKVVECFCNTSIDIRYKEFCVMYLGVRRHWSNQDTRYIVLNPSAIWLKKIDSRFIQRSGNMVFVDACSIQFTAQNYWCSVLFYVCVDVLDTLKSLHLHSLKTNLPLFQQNIILLYMFEVAKFVETYNFRNREYNGARTAETYLKLSIHNFLDNVFCVDWKKSSEKEMISLRGTECSMELLKEAISRNIMSTSTLTYGRMGRAMMLILGSGQPTAHLNEKIMRSFVGKPKWMEFFKILFEKRNSDISGSCASLVLSFFDVLRNTFEADWRTEVDYMSPSYFIYLLERLLISVSSFREHFFTTRASCLEWLIYEGWKLHANASPVNKQELTSLVEDVYNFMAFTLSELLLNKDDTLEWINKLHIHSVDCHHPVLITRLVVLLCLICLNSRKHLDTLFDCLGSSDIRLLLPVAFCDALQGIEERGLVHALADALEKVGSPLVIANFSDTFLEYSGQNIISLNAEMRKFSRDELIELFFKDGDDQSVEKNQDESYHESMSTVPLVKDEVDGRR